jgi:ABC-type branched-subunit amino acid transport system ATPase component
MGFEAGKFSYEAVFDWFLLLKERQFQPTGTLSGGVSVVRVFGTKGGLN